MATTGMVKLMAEYDDFMRLHIKKHANLGSGHVNNLSSTMCEELAEVMGKGVLDAMSQV